MNLINNRYKVVKVIGEGGFAKVYLAKDTHMKDMPVALKRFDAGKLREKAIGATEAKDMNLEKYSVLAEFRRGMNLTHPNIIRYYDAFKYREDSNFGGEEYEMGVMEYLEDGDWDKFVKENGTNNDAFDKAVMGVLKGIQYLHNNKVVHRDIKSSNILFMGETPKITDLGISKRLERENDGSISLQMGTPDYMSPEQNSPTDFGINKKVSYNTDLWSFGVMLYYSFLGKMPFGGTKEGLTSSEIRKNVLSKKYVIPELDKIPAPYQELIRACLVRKAAKRIQTADEAIAILSKPVIDDETVISRQENGIVPIWKKIVPYMVGLGLLLFLGWKFWPIPNPSPDPGSNISHKQDLTKQLDVYFKDIFEGDNVNDKHARYEKRKKQILAMFAKDAQVDTNGMLYNVEDFFINFITNDKTVTKFEIKTLKDGKINDLVVN